MIQGHSRNLMIICGIVLSVSLISPGGKSERTREKRPLRYRVTDLGTLSRCDNTYATAVNDAGYVVGYAYTFVAPGHGNSVMSRPFLWRKGTMIELPKIGGEHGQALTINEQGDIGGYAETKDGEDQPVIWRKSKGYQPEPLSDHSGIVSHIQEDGTAVGSVFDETKRRAALWKSGKLQILGNPNDEETYAAGSNRFGTVVGFSIPKGGSSQSFMSPGDRYAALWKDGQQIALQKFGHQTSVRSGVESKFLSECRAINDNGVAVGWLDGPGARKACVWKEGKVETLPTPKNYASEAHAINKAGDIVGEAQEQANKEGWKWIACIWRNGKMEDLNRLIPANSG